ncbi:hypothetical protein [Streptomyces dysideae]|uniref:hypothetical protein n=1 Tax=Streptomyces dysideae TaxID=909626 RepID=UPI000A7DFDAF|nr:hypothetical protein [Streptomyces dysideae]
MTADVRKSSAIRRPDTGWEKERRRRGSGVRTCVPATVDAGARQPLTDAEWNIVRGED